MDIEYIEEFLDKNVKIGTRHNNIPHKLFFYEGVIVDTMKDSFTFREIHTKKLYVMSKDIVLQITELE